MRNIARLPENDRRELFRNTADKMGLNDAIVEKDFWVCFTLDYRSIAVLGEIQSHSRVVQACPRRLT